MPGRSAGVRDQRRNVRQICDVCTDDAGLSIAELTRPPRPRRAIISYRDIHDAVHGAPAGAAWNRKFSVRMRIALMGQIGVAMSARANIRHATARASSRAGSVRLSTRYRSGRCQGPRAEADFLRFTLSDGAGAVIMEPRPRGMPSAFAWSSSTWSR